MMLWVATEADDPLELPVAVEDSITKMMRKLNVVKSAIWNSSQKHKPVRGYNFEHIWVPDDEGEEMMADFFESCTESVVLQ